ARPCLRLVAAGYLKEILDKCNKALINLENCLTIRPSIVLTNTPWATSAGHAPSTRITLIWSNGSAKQKHCATTIRLLFRHRWNMNPKPILSCERMNRLSLPQPNSMLVIPWPTQRMCLKYYVSGKTNSETDYMKFVRFFLVGCVVALTGCASSGGKYSDKVSYHGPNRDVWDRVRKGFDMPPLQDEKVAYWTNYYAARPGSVQTMAARSGKYIYHITKELEKRNMPTELALLPFVESAYNATAMSRSRASGLWQFIPSTGTHYNLKQDWWKDDRRDPVESTRAALDYLSYLYTFQGNDWHLALASYNWGEGAVKRARSRAGGGGYLDLRMPSETRNYVPKLMAIRNIVANPAKYGITLPSIPDKPYFEKVRRTKDIDVAVMARLAGISVADFKELNPSFNRPTLL